MRLGHFKVALQALEDAEKIMHKSSQICFRRS